MLFKDLERLGLSDNEAKVYHSLLKLGEGGVTQISKACAVNRRNIYDVLRRLGEKGLAYEIREGLSTTYQAVDPKKLVDLLAEDGRVIAEMMPSLQAIFASAPLREDVAWYRGYEGWKKCLREVLQNSPSLEGFIGGRMLEDRRLRDELVQFLQGAVHKKLIGRLLLAKELEMGSGYPAKSIKLGVLPRKYTMESTVLIFGDKLCFVSVAESLRPNSRLSIAVIVDQRLADWFRVWFDFTWSRLQ